MLKEFILRNPFIYKTMQYISGADKWRSVFINEYVRPTRGMKILDICCGTCDVLPVLGKEIYYIGLDYNNDYLEKAKKQFAKDYPKAEFINIDIAKYKVPKTEKFDRIIMMGALHHLSDSEVSSVLIDASSLLKKDGRFCSIDGVFLEKQSPFKRFILKNDRGQYIRTNEHWIQLIGRFFSDADYVVRGDIVNTDQIIFY